MIGGCSSGNVDGGTSRGDSGDGSGGPAGGFGNHGGGYDDPGDGSGDPGDGSGSPDTGSVSGYIQNKDNISEGNIFYTNCRALSNKINELKVAAELYNCKVMCITESHLKDGFLDAELQIPNYSVFRQDRIGREKGGSVIYVHNSLSASLVQTFEAPDSLAVYLDIPSCPPHQYQPQ